MHAMRSAFRRASRLRVLLPSVDRRRPVDSMQGISTPFWWTDSIPLLRPTSHPFSSTSSDGPTRSPLCRPTRNGAKGRDRWRKRGTRHEGSNGHVEGRGAFEAGPRGECGEAMGWRGGMLQVWERWEKPLERHGPEEDARVETRMERWGWTARRMRWKNMPTLAGRKHHVHWNPAARFRALDTSHGSTIQPEKVCTHNNAKFG